MKTIISTCCFFFFAYALYSQGTGPFVWPGDINNNGIVNEVDVLYWGSAYGSEGPARNIVDSSYIGYPIPSAWANFFNNGLNYLYADANGDGRVDYMDLSPIYNHFGMKNDSIVGSDVFPIIPGATPPPISLTTQVDTFQNKKVVIIEVSLGDLATPVDSFYGFSFRLHYDTLFAKNGLTMELAPENWVEQNENDTYFFLKDDSRKGVASVAITRLDHQTVSGSGTLLRASIVIEDIIFTPQRDTFSIELDSARVVSSNLFGYRPDPVQAKVTEIVSSVANGAKVKQDLLKVYPNPAKEYFNIELLDPTMTIEQLQVYNNLGQRIRNISFSESSSPYQINIPQLGPGLYTVVAQTSGGAYSKKILVTR